MIICLHTVKWFQVLLSNICNSVYQVFLSNTNNLHTALWFQTTNDNNSMEMIRQFIWPRDGTLTSTIPLGKRGPESNGNEEYSTFSKLQNWSLTIKYSHIHNTKWFQVLRSNTNNFIQHYTFTFKWFQLFLFIIKGFQTIVFIFIVISTIFVSEI